MQTNKTDAADARAIWTAVQQPEMRTVAAKTEDQQAMLALHRMRALLVKSRTMQVNQLRGLLYEFGVTFRSGRLAGLAEMRQLLGFVEADPLHAGLEFDLTLARGLNYYTGAIFEVGAPEGVEMGSIGGGGRYDDLTGIFGLPGVSGVGISFGLDRIYLVMEQLGLFPDQIDRSLDVFCINFGPTEAREALRLVMRLRDRGLRADLYPTDAKLQKQFKYADKRQAPYVVLIGAEELATGAFTVRNMREGTQQTYKREDWVVFARSLQS